MMKNTEKQVSQIHVRVNHETRKKWLEICKMLSGNTQSAVFKNMVLKIHKSITEISNIQNYETTA